jgi:hypothetical protein
LAKKKKITLKIKPDYSGGSGHTEYSGYGPHRTFKDNRRAKNKREEQDIKKNPDLE